MPRWLWILLGVLAALALIVWLVMNLDVNTKEDGALVLGNLLASLRS